MFFCTMRLPPGPGGPAAGAALTGRPTGGWRGPYLCRRGFTILRLFRDFQMRRLQGEAGGRGLIFVDLDLGHSTTCPVVLGQMGVWLNWLCSWATLWNI